MSTITIDAIELTDFKSFVGHCRVDLSTGAGLKFVGGRNLMEPALGANGSGKSTAFSDAVCWCAWGSSTRGARTARLVRRGAAVCQVALHLRVDGVAHVLTRRSNPERITLDDAPADQAMVDKLLLGKEHALRAVLFSQATRSWFFDMSVADRGALFDDVLPLGIWQDAADLAGRRASNAAANLRQIEQQLAFAQGQLAELPDEATMRGRADAWDSEHKVLVETLLDRLEMAEASRDTAAAALAQAQKRLDAVPSERQRDALLKKAADARTLANKAMSRSGAITNTISVVKKQLHLYASAPECPTCRQPIDRHFASKCTKAGNRELAELEHEQQTVTDAIDHNNRVFTETTKQEQQIANNLRILLNDVKHMKQEVMMHENNLSALTDQARAKIAEENPYAAIMEDAAKRRAEIAASIETHETAQAAANADLIRLEWWRSAFKRVRLFQIRRALDSLTMETAAAAAALGLIGWHIAYSTEIETQRGTTKSGVHITVTAPGDEDAGEWSPGELQRVRMAVAVAFAALVQQMAGVYWQWEVYDEPSQWLSPEGIDHMLDYLQERAERTGRSIWLIDHRHLESRAFSEIWQVVKDEEGSHVSRK